MAIILTGCRRKEEWPADVPRLGKAESRVPEPHIDRGFEDSLEKGGNAMDPISVIVAALAAGAAAGVKPTAEQAIKDAYAGLKGFIQRKWQQVSLGQLEANPTSEARRSVVKEDLLQAEAGTDRELLALADKVLDAVAQHAPDIAKSIGVRLEDIKSGGSLRIRDVAAGDVAVDVKNADIHGDVEISGVRADRSGDSRNPRVRQ